MKWSKRHKSPLKAIVWRWREGQFHPSVLSLDGLQLSFKWYAWDISDIEVSDLKGASGQWGACALTILSWKPWDSEDHGLVANRMSPDTFMQRTFLRLLLEIGYSPTWTSSRAFQDIAYEKMTFSFATGLQSWKRWRAMNRRGFESLWEKYRFEIADFAATATSQDSRNTREITSPGTPYEAKINQKDIATAFFTGRCLLLLATRPSMRHLLSSKRSQSNMNFTNESEYWSSSRPCAGRNFSQTIISILSGCPLSQLGRYSEVPSLSLNIWTARLTRRWQPTRILWENKAYYEQN